MLLMVVIHKPWQDITDMTDEEAHKVLVKLKLVSSSMPSDCSVLVSSPFLLLMYIKARDDDSFFYIYQVLLHCLLQPLK